MAGTCWYYLTESQRLVAVPDLDFMPLISAGVITEETMVVTLSHRGYIKHTPPNQRVRSAFSPPARIPCLRPKRTGA